MLDSMAILFTFLTILFYLKFCNCQRSAPGVAVCTHMPTSPPPPHPQVVVRMVVPLPLFECCFTGIPDGVSCTRLASHTPLLNPTPSHHVSIKYTGILGMVFLGGLVLVDLYQLVADRSVLLHEYLGHFLLRGSVLVGVPLLMNIALFYVHFALMTQAGIHDGWLPQAVKAQMEVLTVHWP